MPRLGRFLEPNIIQNRAHDRDTSPARRKRVGHGPGERGCVEARTAVDDRDRADVIAHGQSDLVVVLAAGVIEHTGHCLAEREADVLDALLDPESSEGVGRDHSHDGEAASRGRESATSSSTGASCSALVRSALLFPAPDRPTVGQRGDPAC